MSDYMKETMIQCHHVKPLDFNKTTKTLTYLCLSAL